LVLNLNGNGFGHAFREPARDDPGIGGIPNVIQEDDELVVSDPGYSVLLAQGLPEPLRDFYEYLIANGTAQRVVDQGEAIQIEEQQGYFFFSPARAGKCHFQAISQERSIR
jgi:hypothetical protein